MLTLIALGFAAGFTVWGLLTRNPFAGITAALFLGAAALAASGVVSTPLGAVGTLVGISVLLYVIAFSWVLPRRQKRRTGLQNEAVRLHRQGKTKADPEVQDLLRRMTKEKTSPAVTFAEHLAEGPLPPPHSHKK